MDVVTLPAGMYRKMLLYDTFSLSYVYTGPFVAGMLLQLV